MPGRKNKAETVEQRRERLLLLHVSGRSPRELAEQEGVSLSQVYRDIKDSSEELRGGLLRGDMPAATRMIMVAQEIGARALKEGRYGAALRALDMEVRIRVLVPPEARREPLPAPEPKESLFIWPERTPFDDPAPPPGSDWPPFPPPLDGACDPVLGEVSRQRGSPR